MKLTHAFGLALATFATAAHFARDSGGLAAHSQTKRSLLARSSKDNLSKHCTPATADKDCAPDPYSLKHGDCTYEPDPIGKRESLQKADLNALLSWGDGYCVDNICRCFIETDDYMVDGFCEERFKRQQLAGSVYLGSCLNYTTLEFNYDLACITGVPCDLNGGRTTAPPPNERSPLHCPNTKLAPGQYSPPPYE